MQTFFLAPTRQNVGLTSISLGIVLALQRQGLRVGFVKPVPQDTAHIERSAHFARVLCQIDSPNPLDIDLVLRRIADNQTDELLEDVVSLCMTAAQDKDVLIVEGLHNEPGKTYAAKLNSDIARTLQAEMVLVANASKAGAAAEANLLVNQLRSEGRSIAGIVFNKALDNFDLAAAEKELTDTRIWGVVKFDLALRAARTLDVARHLEAEVLVEGEIAQRRVLETLIAARSASNVIDRLKPGTLVVSAGDRDDIMLATALAVSQGIQLAGLVLTHESFISEKLIEFSPRAFCGDLPIIRAKGDTFTVAWQLSNTPTAVAVDDNERMGKVLDSVAEQLCAKTLAAAVEMPASTRMSPPAFRFQLIQKARAARKRIVLPEGDEPRTIKAAIICEEKGIAHCILLGKREAIEAVAQAQGVTLPSGLEILDPDSIREKYVAPMVELRKSKGLTPGQARDQMQDTVVLGTMMLAQDDVDGLVSGAVHTTANTVRPAMQLIKTAPGSSIVSSVFFMLMPDQVLVYGDCAINTNPDAQQLAEIALQSADSAKAFGVHPKVAMISYSTGTSGAGEDVERVAEAVRIAKERAPELELDGPLQYDAASVLEVGRQKAPNSKVAGQATVFVFPDLNTGNTTYKAVQRSANVVSVGPMLQGLRKPVNDLSRGALVDDIVFTIALTAIQADSMQG